MSIVTKALRKAQEIRTGVRSTATPQLRSRRFASQNNGSAAAPKNVFLGKNNFLRFFVMVSFGAIVLGVLTGVLMVYINRSVPAPTATTVPITKNTPLDDAVGKVQKSKLPSETDSVKTLPDNIVPPESQPASPGKPPSASAGPISLADLPLLSGIMYSPANPRAVINGTMVSEGDQVNDFTILKILPGKVKMSFRDKEIDLKLR